MKLTMAPSLEDRVKLRSNVITLVFVLFFVASWLVISDQKQIGELLHDGVKTVKSSNNTSTLPPYFNVTLAPVNTTTTAVLVSLDCNDTWPEISNRLCPDMKPKYELASTIFRLARQELIKGASSSNASGRLEDCNGMEDRMPPLFFHFVPGANSRASDGSNKNQVFTYFPIWKCANSQLRVYWEQIFGNIASKEFNERSTWKRQNPKPECIVAAVRDPISHFLSAYNEIETRIHQFRGWRERPAKTWPFGRLKAGSTERFQQLITDLLNCPMARQYKGILDSYPGQLEMQHLFSMTGFLRSLSLDQSVNMTRDVHYLPSLDDLEHTWPQFMVKSCPESFSNATATHILATKMNSDLGSHKSSKDLLGTYAAAKRVWSEGGSFAKALCALHILDYACWKDLPEGVPNLCLDLYVSYSVDNLI
jgi:hypothetical protein